MSRINTVLFDFDGTIMNTNDLILNSWQHTFRTITGAEADPEMIKKTFGEVLMDSMEKFFPGYPVDEAVEIYRGYQRGKFSQEIFAFDGMIELMKELKEKGYKVAVVTSRLKRSTMDGLKKYGVDTILDAVVTADECKAHKPDPEPALMALRMMNSKPEESIMVGDSKFDIGCANNAGATSVLVDWAVAIYDKSQEGMFKPDYTMDKAQRLWDIIEDLDSK